MSMKKYMYTLTSKKTGKKQKIEGHSKAIDKAYNIAKDNKDSIIVESNNGNFKSEYYYCETYPLLKEHGGYDNYIEGVTKKKKKKSVCVRTLRRK